MVKARSLRPASFGGRDVLALAVLLAVVAGTIGLRKPIVEVAPGLASLYDHLGLPVNVRGLEFENVSTLRDNEDGAAGLVVQGEVRNLTDGNVAVPLVRLALADGNGRELHAWTAIADPRTLAAGEVAKFKTRMVAPPDPARRVALRFTADAPEGTN